MQAVHPRQVGRWTFNTDWVDVVVDIRPSRSLLLQHLPLPSTGVEVRPDMTAAVGDWVLTRGSTQIGSSSRHVAVLVVEHADGWRGAVVADADWPAYFPLFTRYLYWEKDDDRERMADVVQRCLNVFRGALSDPGRWRFPDDRAAANSPDAQALLDDSTFAQRLVAWSSVGVRSHAMHLIFADHGYAPKPRGERRSEPMTGDYGVTDLWEFGLDDPYEVAFWFGTFPFTDDASSAPQRVAEHLRGLHDLGWTSVEVCDWLDSPVQEVLRCDPGWATGLKNSGWSVSAVRHLGLTVTYTGDDDPRFSTLTDAMSWWQNAAGTPALASLMIEAEVSPDEVPDVLDGRDRVEVAARLRMLAAMTPEVPLRLRDPVRIGLNTAAAPHVKCNHRLEHHLTA